MGLRQPVKLGEEVKYPSLAEVVDFATDFRDNHQQGGNDTLTRRQYYYNKQVDVYIRGCPTWHYQVYAWTVAGFEISGCEEVDLIEGFVGWILRWIPAQRSWVVLADTRTDGIAGFKEVKHSVCPSPPRTGKGWLPYEPAKEP